MGEERGAGGLKGGRWERERERIDTLITCSHLVHHTHPIHMWAFVF
jgi:hypothetical protein